MRKVISVLAATAAILSVGFIPDRARAMTLAPANIRGAIANIDVMDPVHCRPGVWHHVRRPHDGCGAKVIIREGGARREGSERREGGERREGIERREGGERGERGERR